MWTRVFPPECKTWHYWKTPIKNLARIGLKEQTSEIIKLQSQLVDYKKAGVAKVKTNALKNTRGQKCKQSFPPSSPTTSDDSADMTDSIEISPNLKDIENDKSLRGIHKRKNVEQRTKTLFTEIEDICCSHRESLGSILGHRLIADDEDVETTMDELVDIVIDRKGTREGFKSIFSDSKWLEYFKELRQPDWVLLYLKLQAKIPDEAWQTLLNITYLGRGKNSKDTPLLLTKSQIKAVRRMVFSIIKKSMGVRKLDNIGKQAYEVDLRSVVIWGIREMRLFGQDKEEMEFNIKLDGRTLGGRDQVLIGLVPMSHKGSTQSSKSVYPIAIANCQESREEIEALLETLNVQKNALKLKKINVDGKQYKINFTVTADYKALSLLMKKKGCEDETWRLGGRGLDTEFCIYCLAIRGCACKITDDDGACVGCLKDCFNRSKANIGSWTGLRDDLEFLLDEELSSVMLCALHCEMRNTEQLLGSVGLFAHRASCLDELNNALSRYGPESFKKKRINVKLRNGQETSVEKRNIKVATFSGPTEREILRNLETIMDEGMPVEKIAAYYRSTEMTAKQSLLDRYTFCEYMRNEVIDEMRKSKYYSRDYGTHQDDVLLNDLPKLKAYLDQRFQYWTDKKKEIEAHYLELFPTSSKSSKVKGHQTKRTSDEAARYAAEVQKDFYKAVFIKWREIALVMREETFEDDADEDIDIYDVKAKEWGFLLREVFGDRLGTGDYGHLTVEHTAMLFRRFRSFKRYSNQGFEALHRMQRQLYTRATNHDGKAFGQSIEDMLVHHYSEKLLFFRLCVHNAIDCYENGKPFFFRGCGWKRSNAPHHTDEDVKWLEVVRQLLNAVFGRDYLDYYFDKEYGLKVKESSIPTYVYDHDSWENEYDEKYRKQSVESSQTTKPKKKARKLFSESQTMSSNNLDEADPSSSISSLESDSMALPCHTSTPLKSNTSISPTTSTHGQGHVKPSSPPPTTYNSEKRFIDCPVSAAFSSNDFGLCHASSRASRKQLANLVLPKVQQDCSTNIIVSSQSLPTLNPFFIKTRPSRSALAHCDSLLSKSHRNGTTANVVQFGSVGTFNVDDLWLLRKFCDIDDTRRHVIGETNWLNQEDGFDMKEMEALSSALWDNDPFKVILKIADGRNTKSIDVTSLTYLCEERYIDNMVIDVSLLKYMIELNTSESVKSLVLPSGIWSWKECAKGYLKEKISTSLQNSQSRVQDLQQIIIPVYMPSHWAIVYVDLTETKVYFDDGMKFSPPNGTLESVKEFLDVLHRLHPECSAFLSERWKSVVSLERLGMPSQVARDAKMSGQGSGSCGIGVLMAAKYLMSKGNNVIGAFPWTFAHSRKYRKELMLQILKWAS